jgi:hypothetical protein
MPTLAFLINADLSLGFTVAQVAQKHAWTDPMVWSLPWKKKRKIKPNLISDICKQINEQAQSSLGGYTQKNTLFCPVLNF